MFAMIKLHNRKKCIFVDSKNVKIRNTFKLPYFANTNLSVLKVVNNLYYLSNREQTSSFTHSEPSI